MNPFSEVGRKKIPCSCSLVEILALVILAVTSGPHFDSQILGLGKRPSFLPSQSFMGSEMRSPQRLLASGHSQNSKGALGKVIRMGCLTKPRPSV